MSSHISPQGYRPSYCVAPAKYFSTTPIVPTVSRSVGSSYSSKPVSARVSATGSSRYFDPDYPSRQFGSRLSKGYSAVHVRPELHGKPLAQLAAISSRFGYLSCCGLTVSIALCFFYIRHVFVSERSHEGDSLFQRNFMAHHLCPDMAETVGVLTD